MGLTSPSREAALPAPSATDQPARHTNGRFGPGNPGRRAVLTRILDRELRVEAPAIDDFSDAELDRTVRLARPPRTALTVINGETGAEPRQRRPGPLRTASTVINGETGPNHANADAAPSAHRIYGV